SCSASRTVANRLALNAPGLNRRGKRRRRFAFPAQSKIETGGGESFRESLMSTIVSRSVSLVPAATEIAAARGLREDVVGVSHECHFPSEAKARPRVSKCPMH